MSRITWIKVRRQLFISAFVIIAAAPLFMPESWLLPHCGMLAGVTAIFLVVHHVNRRDDPRTAKRPPDLP
jgi:hypothetical protein